MVVVERLQGIRRAPEAVCRRLRGVARSVGRSVKVARSPVLWQEMVLRARFRRAGLRNQRIQLPRTKIHAWIGGREGADTVLLLQGFGSDALWQWHPQVEVLAEKYHLVVPDLVFFGRSTSEHDDRSLHFQTDTMVALLDHLGVQKVHLAGISYGGLVAYDMAYRHPDRVDRLIIVASPGPAFTPDDHAHILRQFAVDELAELLVPTNPEGVGRLIELAWRKPPKVPGFALKDAHRNFFSRHQEERTGLINHVAGMADDPTLNTRKVPHETLLLWGEHDPVFPLHLARKLRSMLGPRARLRILTDTAHAPNQERPHDFNRLLLEFLEAPRVAAPESAAARWAR